MSDEKTVVRSSVISNTDAELADVIASQPTEEQIKASTTETFDPWVLPKEAVAYEGKRYKYRWVNKDKRYIARHRAHGWLICSRQNSPYLPEKGFGVHGGYQNDTFSDHLLAFMPMERANQHRKEVSQKSTNAVKYYTEDIKKDPRFYEAKLGNPDGSDDDATGFVQGRDFE